MVEGVENRKCMDKRFQNFEYSVRPSRFDLICSHLANKCHVRYSLHPYHGQYKLLQELRCRTCCSRSLSHHHYICIHVLRWIRGLLTPMLPVFLLAPTTGWFSCNVTILPSAAPGPGVIYVSMAVCGTVLASPSPKTTTMHYPLSYSLESFLLGSCGRLGSMAKWSSPTGHFPQDHDPNRSHRRSSPELDPPPCHRQACSLGRLEDGRTRSRRPRHRAA